MAYDDVAKMLAFPSLKAALQWSNVILSASSNSCLYPLSHYIQNLIVLSKYQQLSPQIN